ncbi:anthranilate synthase component II [Suttonella indologenes]|uniref:Para-aminobenzoate synthase glutamine amidotransferase component II n=1 Tax=Suttonella indologenes TaxID=13276 RepID=A0A380MX22_9GAMM|nr:aminodeoxychorismate/anthranilate synthase component II [Suttonella indologenes]SUO96261.1 Para-aminobenzoate synthase glutamine amidotransferase component II [Suttonella indologenes]
MLLMIDNYDSFTYNLVQYFAELGQDVLVKRNDETTVAEIEALQPDYLVISPGPCTPKEAGISNAVIRHFAGKVPLLGVCLGHQCMADVFGGRVKRAKQVMHGKTSLIQHNNKGVFKDLPMPLQVTRYHSLVVEMPQDFELTAWFNDAEEQVVMGMRHRQLPLEGVQFHPESFMSEAGYRLLANFLHETSALKG